MLEPKAGVGSRLFRCGALRFAKGMGQTQALPLRPGSRQADEPYPVRGRPWLVRLFRGTCRRLSDDGRLENIPEPDTPEQFLPGMVDLQLHHGCSGVVRIEVDPQGALAERHLYNFSYRARHGFRFGFARRQFGQTGERDFTDVGGWAVGVFLCSNRVAGPPGTKIVVRSQGAGYDDRGLD